MVPNPMNVRDLPLPIAKEKLYVNRPIGAYEPYSEADTIKAFKPDVNLVFKKKWHSSPLNHKETRDIAGVLSGE